MRTEIYKNEYEGLNRVERRRLERKHAKDATKRLKQFGKLKTDNHPKCP